MEPFKKLVSRVVALPAENVDTDQIIPARFLKVTDKAGLGDALFADWRYAEDGTPRPDFVLNRPESRGAQILLAGNNFGCGSSREHAPWALAGFGFRAVVSTYFADIFRSNALKNGILPVVVKPEVHARLFRLAEERPNVEIGIDLRNRAIRLPGGKSATFPIDPFARHCLLNGVDQLGFLLAERAAIARYEAANPGRVYTLAGGEEDTWMH